MKSSKCGSRSSVGHIIAVMAISLSFLHLVPCISNAAVLRTKMLSKDPSSFRGATVAVELTGDIVHGDAEKLDRELSPYHDSNYNKVLLLDSYGGNFEEALSLAQVVSRVGVATFVNRTGRCFSACAFVFLAGTRHEPFEPPSVDRVLEPGGSIRFHAPYHSQERGRFEDGVAAVRKLKEVLGPAIPDELFSLALDKRHYESFEVSTVGEAVRWGISLWKYETPEPTREGLLQACLNEALQRGKTDIGEVVGLKPSQEPSDSSSYPTQMHSLQLLDPKDTEVERLRREERAPWFLRFSHIGDSYASQFAFAQEGMQYQWCSISHDTENWWIYIKWEKVDPRSLIFGSEVLPTSPDATVRDWFQYLPETRLVDLAPAPGKAVAQ